MTEWWNGLTQANQVFYGAAGFMAVLFVWQLISVLMGLDGGDEVDGVDADIEVDADVDADVDVDHTYDECEDGAEGDAVATVTSFKLLTVRSIITFFTMFTWAGALYMDNGCSLTRAIGLGVAWGAAGMLLIAGLFHFMKKMTHTGTKKLSSCVGTEGSVYLDIPAEGTGEVRVTVTGTLSFVKARAEGGAELKAGTPIEVIRTLDETTVEVAAR